MVAYHRARFQFRKAGVIEGRVCSPSILCVKLWLNFKPNKFI